MKRGPGLGFGILDRYDLRARQAEQRVITEDEAGQPKALVTAFDYDGNGNVDLMTETFRKLGEPEELAVTHTVDRGYDNFNRLTSEIATRGAEVTNLSWTYDDDGRRLSVTQPGNRVLTYEYNGLGYLRWTRDAVAGDTEHDLYDNGLTQFLNHANGTKEEWTYKQGTQEVSSLVITDSAATDIRTVTYTYDDDGNRTGETDVRPGQDDIVRTNYYDDAGRLWKVEETSPANRTTTYTYDKLGNRLTEVVTEDVTEVTNLATSFDGAGILHTVIGTKDGDPYNASFSYDLAGNLVTRNEDGTIRAMKYDLAGRMVALSEGGAQLSAYVYNAEGRRIMVLEGGITRTYVYDGRSLLVEYSEGILERRYLYGDRLLGLSTASDTNRYALHLDPLGSTLEVTGSEGLAYSSNAYDPWGGVETTGAEGPSKVLYTGHQFDDETGFYYFGARYYDPALGRFLRPDPYFGELTTPPSLHKYLYAYANPIKWIDLEGYQSNYYQYPETNPVYRCHGIGAEPYPEFVWDILEYPIEFIRVPIEGLVYTHLTEPMEKGEKEAEQFKLIYREAETEEEKWQAIKDWDRRRKAEEAEEGTKKLVRLGKKVVLIEAYENIKEGSVLIVKGETPREHVIGTYQVLSGAADVYIVYSIGKGLLKEGVVLKPGEIVPEEQLASQGVRSETLSGIEDRIRLHADLSDIRATGTTRTYGRFGTRAHKEFEALNAQLNRELKASGSRFRLAVEEFRDISGSLVRRRAAGSLGTDVVVYESGIPVAGFDLKTGRPWDAAKLLEVQRRFGVSITQIRTNPSPSLLFRE